MNTRACGPDSSRRESAISAAREMPIAAASSTSASSRGVSQPAAVSGITAESSASRTEVAASGIGSTAGLLFQAPALLGVLQRGGDVVELAAEHRLEVVDGEA